MIRLIDVSKTVGGKKIISDMNMTVKKGEIYGFLGPNGAGKTTVMKMLLNFVKPTTGSIELFGEQLTPSSYELFKRIGSLIEVPVFYENLSAYDNLEIHAEYMGYYHKQSIDEVLELVGLPTRDKKPVKQFSLGMKQRLAIARAILTKPELLILDEPINGLDPVGMKDMRNLFQMLNKEYGMTLLISSHLLSEIEQIADTIAVISKGQLMQEVSMEQIRNDNTEYIELITPHQKRACVILEDLLRIQNYKTIDDRMIRIYCLDVPQATISKQLILNDVEIESMTKQVASLEEYFLQMIRTTN